MAIDNLLVSEKRTRLGFTKPKAVKRRSQHMQAVCEIRVGT